MPGGDGDLEKDYGWSMAGRGQKVVPAMRTERSDLLDLAERTRARWDLLEFIKVSVKQWWRNLEKRK